VYSVRIASLLQATRQAARIAAAAVCIVAVGACATVQRVPYTEQEQAGAKVPGIPGARAWADDPALASRGAGLAPLASRQPVILALSGGAADGAFGAGLLNGWSAAGTRPQFTIVTGASAGALMAPFAFVGPSHDEVLKNVFYSGDMEGLLQPEGVRGLFGTGLFKAAPLRELIAKYIDANMLEAVAREYRLGRRLYITTTNLDAQRTAIWDMGGIAASGHPKALELFRSVMEASASIPGIFSPVLIDVESEGKRFAEMHVDGGITANLLVIPDAMLSSASLKLPKNVRPKIYVVINGKLGPDFEVVKPQTLRIAIRSFLTSVRANTRNTLLASYEFIKRRGWELNIAAIDDGFPEPEKMGFDTAYMRKLFEYGFERARSGEAWRKSLDGPSRPQLVASQPLPRSQ
jgi:hypothetical protein